MSPRLAAMAGPLEGTVIPLTEDEISVGRDRSNLIWINDVSVSRRHSVIKRAGDAYHITDLKSYNGTRVNGTPIGERALEHGDMIAVGDSLFLFLRDDDEEAPAETASVEVNEERCEIQTTVVLRIEDAIYLQPDKLLAALPATARIARGLNALLNVSTAINSITGVEALERRLLELIFEIVPAERGALLLDSKASDEFASVFGRDRLRGGAQPVQVSRTIINQVRRDGAAILCNDVLESEALRQSDSLIASRIQSLICVPLMLFGKISGVLYLDTSDRSVRFDHNHLQLVTAISSIAAVALRNAQSLEHLEGENRRLEFDLNIEHNMVGESARMRDVLQFIGRAGPTDSTVLIHGESGTGKELVARAIHKASARRGKPFVAINCAALTETLLESELFGHEKGAFTGAIAQKKGKFEVGDGGTVFLDEVGELAPVLQAKLLRVLQEREFERVGGIRPVKVNIRLVAATNKDLEAATRTGGFRQDLYYRLNVVGLTLPPLRERRDDILLLANYFASKYALTCKRRVTAISPEARACLLSYDWPGNIRELENAVERAVVLGSTDEILPEDLPESLLEMASTSVSGSARYTHAIKEAKKQIVLTALETAGGNYIEAARSLGIHPNNLHRLIRNLDLKHTPRT
jgi:transcriptional regulator with GAF, ATPase, and Fis domain